MTHKTNYDYIIVGQGLAGTLMAFFLEQAGKTVGLIDQPDERAASQVAAGLINPVTGRRYVKSWRIDQLLPFAEKTYRAIEDRFDIKIYHQRNILRSLFNSREENDWLLRTAEPGYESYLLDTAHLGKYAEHTVPAFSYGEVSQAAQVNLPLLIDTYRKYLVENERIITGHFDYDAIEFEAEQVRYQQRSAKTIIFCEGHKAIHNPYFNYLPFRGAKGEVLIIRIADIDFEKILKHRVFIAPLGDQLYWVGSSYVWQYQDEHPTAQGKAFLLDRLADILQVPFEVVEHRSAIRPTVKDRRPFLGRHAEWPQLAIFNGLGTKGTSLGPFWAKALQEHLCEDKTLDPAVDIQRFVSE